MTADDSHDPTLSPDDGQKKENLLIVRGDRYAQRPGRTFSREEICLDEDMKKIFDAVRDANGRAPSRGFSRVKYDEAFPWRVLARYVVRAADVEDIDDTQILAIAERFTRFVYETLRNRRRRHRSAA